MLESLAFLYLLIPALMFIIGWIKPVYALIIAGLLVISAARYVNFKEDWSIYKGHGKKLAICFVILCLWVFSAGTGGFVWQNYWDHKFRNAVFMDLVNKPWPVVQDEFALCYYFGFWLPAALVGKLFGLTAGYFFQTVWAIIGLSLAVLLMFRYLGAVKIRTVVLLIFFSGLDILFRMGQGLEEGQSLAYILTQVMNGEHLELLMKQFNSSSNTTLLYWLYNQTIPFWLGFMLLLHQKNNQAIVLIYVLMLMFCPFPCVAVAPVLAFLWLRNQPYRRINRESVLGTIKGVFTLENITAVLFVMVLGLFYMSNIASGTFGTIGFSPAMILHFCVFFTFEFGIYLLFVYRENRKDIILHILIITTILCSFIVLGTSYDFAWRTCIPLAFYLVLLIAKKLETISPKSIACICLIAVLCIGAVTPMTEMIRTAKGEAAVLRGETSARSDSLKTCFTLENNECYENFIANRSRVFFVYLCKK